MADIAQALVFEALTRAAAEPAGVPLYAAKAQAGLFAASAVGKAAAQRCKDAGLLTTARPGKPSQEVCAITERGLAFLAEQGNPRFLLAAFVDALARRDAQLQALQESVERGRHDLTQLTRTATRVLEHLDPRATLANVGEVVCAELDRRHEAGALDDCPLPELFRRLQATFAKLTVGLFHDELRRLHRDRLVYLHPWTGPLYDLPEPALALLVGHEVAYYASRRA